MCVHRTDASDFSAFLGLHGEFKLSAFCATEDADHYRLIPFIWDNNY